MKKMLLILGLILVTSPCFAGGVGYINYEKVVAFVCVFGIRSNVWSTGVEAC